MHDSATVDLVDDLLAIVVVFKSQLDYLVCAVVDDGNPARGSDFRVGVYDFNEPLKALFTEEGTISNILYPI